MSEADFTATFEVEPSFTADFDSATQLGGGVEDVLVDGTSVVGTDHIANIDGMASETWVEAKGYLTEHQSLAAYRTSAAQDVIDAGKAQVPTKATATINVADWSNKTATCSITGLRVDSDLTQLVHCVFSDNATMLSAKPWFSCSTAGTLTVTCQGDVPTAAVTVAVVMQEVG